MHEVPTDLLYSAEHHWVRVLGPATAPEGLPGAPSDGSPEAAAEGSVAQRWGLTAHARHHLGELVAATLPAVGAALRGGQAYGEVECTTTVADLFAPAGATVTATNEALAASPELLGADPYGEGWLVTVVVPAGQPLDPAAAADRPLMDADAYRALVAAPDPRVDGRERAGPLQ